MGACSDVAFTGIFGLSVPHTTTTGRRTLEPTKQTTSRTSRRVAVSIPLSCAVHIFAYVRLCNRACGGCGARSGWYSCHPNGEPVLYGRSGARERRGGCGVRSRMNCLSVCHCDTDRQIPATLVWTLSALGSW